MAKEHDPTSPRTPQERETPLNRPAQGTQERTHLGGPPLGKPEDERSPIDGLMKDPHPDDRLPGDADKPAWDATRQARAETAGGDQT